MIMKTNLSITDGSSETPNIQLLDSQMDKNFCPDDKLCLFSWMQPFVLRIKYAAFNRRQCGGYLCLLENATRHILLNMSINMRDYFAYCLIGNFNILITELLHFITLPLCFNAYAYMLFEHYHMIINSAMKGEDCARIELPLSSTRGDFMCNCSDCVCRVRCEASLIYALEGCVYSAALQSFDSVGFNARSCFSAGGRYGDRFAGVYSNERPGYQT